MRFYTVPDRQGGPASRWSGPSGSIGIFYLFTLVLGYGAAALVGPDTIIAAPGKAQLRPPHCSAFELGGTAVLLGIISAVAFATILAVVAGLTITASAVVRPRHLRQRHQARARSAPTSRRSGSARITAVVHRRRSRSSAASSPTDQNIAFLVALAFAVAASRQPADHPVLAVLEAVQHPAAPLWSIYGGLISAIILIAFSPGRLRQGDPKAASMITDRRRLRTGSRWSNPGIVSIPLGLLPRLARHA